MNAVLVISARDNVATALEALDTGRALQLAAGQLLVAEAIPVSAAARERAGATGQPPLRHALGDGEDFELVFVVSPEDGRKLLTAPPVPGLVKIGECVESGLWLEANGTRQPLAPGRRRRGRRPDNRVTAAKII